MRIQMFVLLMGALSLRAHAAPFHGHFIICSDAEDTLKMTADLSDGKGEKVATSVQNGLKLLFPETSGGKVQHQFSFYSAKTAPLLVTRTGQKDPEIRLVMDPSRTEGPELLHHRTEPFLYRISRYNAFLSLRSFRVVDQKVTCTESQWESD